MEKYRELLERTLEVQSKSKNEKRMKRFVREYLKKLGLTPEHDDKGNIYCHKGDKRRNRPFVVAHLDTVHEVNGNVSLYYNEKFGYYFAMDDNKMEQYGVGGDDKVGVWAALAAITEFDDISIALYVQEEIGCVGSSNGNLAQLKKANWLVQLDRRGFEDFITYNMASKEFLEDMVPLAEAYGLKNRKHSTITDVSALFRRKVGVSAVNISSGYYMPHTNSEVVVWDDASNALQLIFAMILQNGEKKYPHLPYVPKPKALPATTTNDVKVNGFTGGMKKFKERFKAGKVKYVQGKIRMWNAFFGCYEWRDYSGNLLYYEGFGEKAQWFSRNAKHVRVANAEEPVFQEAVPYNDIIYDNETVYCNHDIYGNKVESDSQSELDFDDYRDAPGFDDQETDEEYWNRMSMDAEIRDRYDRVKANKKFSKEDEDIKTYHDFEEKYANNVEMTAARNHLDAVLYLYGFSFVEFLQGRIPDDAVKNISSSLHYDHGNTLAYYERIFNIEGCYDNADTSGCFTNFSKDSLHNQPTPF